MLFKYPLENIGIFFMVGDRVLDLFVVRCGHSTEDFRCRKLDFGGIWWSGGG